MIDGRDLIHLAGRLAAGAQADEAICRCAVSRAYYGSFHLALAFLAEIEVKISTTGNAHSLVQRYLTGCGHAEAQQAGMTLSSLHGDRIAADYRLDSDRFNVPFARSRVALAHDVASALDACRNDHAKRAVGTGIKDYRRRIGESVD